MFGIIGKKIGMTSLYNVEGKNIPCTVVETDPCLVTQIKNTETDGYNAIQLAYGECKKKHTTKALQGHFDKSNITPKKHLVEFRNFRIDSEKDIQLGQKIKIEDVFSEGDYVDASAISKGKGFQGVVKRHNFSGVGQATHGQHNRLRSPGSIGGASYPARVFKGMRMAGRMGGKKTKVINLRILKIMPEKKMLVISGSIPGANNSIVVLAK